MTPDVQHRFRVGFSPCIAVIAVLTIGLEPAAKPRTHRLPGYSNIDQFCVEGNDIQLWEFASGEAREFRCTSAASHNEFVGIEGELVMLWASDFHPRTLCRPIGPMAEGLYACIAIEETPVWGRPCLVSRVSRPAIGYNGLGDRCLRPWAGNPADPSVFTRRVGLLSSHFFYNGLVNRCGESRLRTIGLSEPARFLGNLRRPHDLYQVPARVGGFHASSSYR